MQQAKINSTPIHFDRFDYLLSKFGDLETTALYCRMIYHFQNTKIKKKGKKWFARSREDLANWANISLSKLDRILAILENNGFIIKQSFIFAGIRKMHISIPEEKIEDLGLVKTKDSPKSVKNNDVHKNHLLDNSKEEKKSTEKESTGFSSTSVEKSSEEFRVDKKSPNTQNDDFHVVKMTTSLESIENKSKENNNINNSHSIDNAKVKESSTEKDAVSFSSDPVENPTDENGMLIPKARKTVINMVTNFEKEGKVSSPKQLIQQVIFVLESKYYFPNKPFWHRFNICKKLIRTNKWTTPKGMQKHHHDLDHEPKKDAPEAEQIVISKQRQREFSSGKPSLLDFTTEKVEKNNGLLDELQQKLKEAETDYESTKENKNKLVAKLSHGNETKAKRFSIRIQGAIIAKEKEIDELQSRINRLSHAS